MKRFLKFADLHQELSRRLDILTISEDADYRHTVDKREQ